MELEQQVRAAATTKRVEAQKRLDDATGELQKLRDRHEEQVKQLKEVMATDVLQTMRLEPETVEQIDHFCYQLGLPGVAGSAGELLSALEGTRGVLRRTSAGSNTCRQRSVRVPLLMSAPARFGPPVVAVRRLGLLGAGSSSAVGPAASFAGWLSATLAAGAAWLRDRTKHLNAQVEQIEKLQQHARQRVEAEQQAQKAEACNSNNASRWSRTRSSRSGEQQEAVSRLEQIQAQLAATTPASVLADFVREAKLPKRGLSQVPRTSGCYPPRL